MCMEDAIDEEKLILCCALCWYDIRRAVLTRPVDTTASHLVFALLIQTIQHQLLHLPLV